MVLTISPKISNTLCYIICWHVFARNVVPSYTQNYCIRCIILYNQLQVSFHLFDSSSYKWSKSGIAFLQTGIKFIYSYALYHTCTLNKCFPTKTNCFIVLGISWDEIVILFRKNKGISLRKSLNKWCRSLLGAIALLSILLLNAFLYSSMPLFILLLIQGSVTLFSLIKKGWYLLLTSI